MTERVHVNATSPTGLDVEFDISLLQVPCSLLNIDANDPSGQTQSLHLDHRHHVWKHRLKPDPNGREYHFFGDRRKLEQGSTLLNEDHLEETLDKLEDQLNQYESEKDDDDEYATDCGSCYGAGDEGECCNTCDDVKRAYKRKGWHLSNPKDIKQCAKEMNQNSNVNDEGEGCNVHGLIALDSGGGSFHLAPGRDHSMSDMSDINSVFELLMSTFEQFNVTHQLHKIRFGDEYPGSANQLDGQSRVIADGYGMYQYYFKIVPTTVKYRNGTSIQTNQYSVTEHLRHVNPGSGRGLPGVFFFYEISPLHVEIVEGYRKGYIAFLTSVCAIVGGVVTTMGLLDQVLYSHTQKGSRG
eukprot:CAMPEP_0116150300 /NCGR_PEP_ID=MMETSP0329-20121206/19466_1 /TAXON_ID=697910 /ORGANISM="Pseudo-nitzschia arenysensis, Strain B593" /LENGTH=353 /DNA_ID=CAMNT_0003646789 /DNA_START=233 /DNA_END=1291 /DNA_ORIENTATION=-